MTDWSSIFSGLFERIQFTATIAASFDQATLFMLRVSADAIQSIAPTVRMLLVMYITLWGIAMMYGKVQQPIVDAGKHFAQILIVTELVLNISSYNLWVLDFFWYLPGEIVKEFIGVDMEDMVSAIPNSLQMLDWAYSAAKYLGEKYMQDATAAGGSTPDYGALSMGGLVWGTGMTLTVASVSILVIAKLSLAILLAVGPVFIVMWLFQPTKTYFQGWMSALLGAVFTLVLFMLALELIMPILLYAYALYLGSSIVSTGLSALLTTTAPTPTISTGFGIASVTLVFVAVLKHVPTMASGIARSVALAAYGGEGGGFGPSAPAKK